MTFRTALHTLLNPSVAALALAGAPFAGPLQGQSELGAAVSWLRANARPIATAAAGTRDASDLAPVAEMIGDASVVALGGETHGVGSFLTLDHRIFQYLVEQKGFRVLILEDSFELVRALDDALVAGGVAEAFDELELGWHVKNAEVRDLLVWMEEQNRERSPSERLRVQGLDVQNVSDAARGLETMLLLLEPGLSSSERELLVAFRDFSWHIGNFPSETRAAMSRDLAGISKRLAQFETELVAQTSRATWELALRRVRLLEQCKAHEETLALAPEKAQALRDAYFAENALWILEQAGPEARAVVLTHNIHASRSGYTASWEETVALTPSMGAHLSRTLGTGYIAFGTYGYRGPLTPHAGGVAKRDRAPEGTWNDAFFRTGHPLFALDLRAIPTTGSAAHWLGKEHAQSWGSPIGSSLIVQEHFDALLFVERTTVPGE